MFVVFIGDLERDMYMAKLLDGWTWFPIHIHIFFYLPYLQELKGILEIRLKWKIDLGFMM